MNILDIILIVIVLIQAAYWAHVGFTQSVFSIVGFWAGFIGGALLAPIAISYATDPGLQILIALAMMFGAAAIVGSIGKLIGVKINRLTHRLRLGPLDSALGAVTGAAVTLLGAWLIVSLFSGIPFQGINSSIRNSAIIQSMNETLPPAPAIISGIGNIIRPDAFPQVFIGPEPRPVEPVDAPSSADVESAIAAAGTATVRVEGPGCGGVVTGSGFVVDANLIATNAHVVAGIENPIIVDVDGERPGEVIYFDSDQDIAILRTNNLAGEPLSISGETYSRGTAAVALGYPGGGRLSGAPAGVLRQIEARGFDIYGERPVVRSMYELQSEIVSGNSGGPVVLPDGTVIGIVVSRSASNPNTGYAVVAAEVERALSAARTNPARVSTGSCVRN